MHQTPGLLPATADLTQSPSAVFIFPCSSCPGSFEARTTFKQIAKGSLEIRALQTSWLIWGGVVMLPGFAILSWVSALIFSYNFRGWIMAKTSPFPFFLKKERGNDKSLKTWSKSTLKNQKSEDEDATCIIALLNLGLFKKRSKYLWMILLISQCFLETIETCEIVHICKYFIPMTKTHVIQAHIAPCSSTGTE